jgi:hypothetical protein
VRPLLANKEERLLTGFKLDPRYRVAAALVLALVWALSILGCSYQRYHTETPRSATEQLLLSGAVQRAVAKLEWPDIAGRPVTVETVSLNDSDAPYLNAVAEARARKLGARVVQRDEAEMVLVVLAGSLGTASRQATFGVPSLPTPFGVTTPELPIVSALKQRGYVGLRLVAYDPAGKHVAESPAVLERASFEIHSFLFLVVRQNDIYPGESLSLGMD